MSATMVFAAAWGVLILSHWANNKPTIDIKQVIQMTVALIIVAALDHGKTSVIANGLAWLFLAAVILSNGSIITKLAKIESAPANQKGK